MTTEAARAVLPRARGSAIGVAAGTASGLLGVGGGFLIVPLLQVWAGFNPRRASGTSLAAILPIATAGALIYYLGARRPEVDVRFALLVVVGSVVGAYLGARLIHRVPDAALRMLVAGLLVVVAIDEWLRALGLDPLRSATPQSQVTLDAAVAAAVVGAGLVIGVLSGLTGVGGGIFLVPTLVLGFGLGQHLAQGTSLLAILPTAAVGAFTHGRRGNVDVPAAAWIGLAGVPAVVLGSVIALALPGRVLAGLFGVLLAVAAYRMWPRRG